MKYTRSILVGYLVAAGCLTRFASATETSERQVQFKGTGGTSIIGTLALPADAAPKSTPALVLIAGSGPTDRDGNQLPSIRTDLLKQIAIDLAHHGIATLRFDKRGMGANASELPKDPKAFDAFFAWNNFVGDVVAAARFLREQKEIDPARVGLLGHSEGGLLALEAAGLLRAENHAPAVLVLLSTPGRTMDRVIADQLQRIMKLQGATPDQAEFFLTAHRRIVTAICKTGKVPSDVPAGLAALYPAYLGRFLQGELNADPAKLASDFAGAVLVIAGGIDVQVSPERDGKALDVALKSRNPDDHRFVLVPDASHNLKPVKTADEPGFEGPVAPQAADELATWVATKLAARSAKHTPH